MPEIQLSIQHICKTFGSRPVLNDVSLDIPRGSVFGLIGLNGVGKTTLIKIILGLLKPDSGSAAIGGKLSTLPSTRKNLFFLPEKFQPSPLLKGHEFLSLTLAYYGQAYQKEQGEMLAKKLSLRPEVLAHRVGSYSKGMGQKLGLLAAFMVDSQLLILDEPMSGLDPSARIQLKDTLMEYAAQGKTVFFSSHILSDMDEICDTIAILSNTKFIYSGSPAAFRKLHKNASLERAFLDAISEPVA